MDVLKIKIPQYMRNFNKKVWCVLHQTFLLFKERNLAKYIRGLIPVIHQALVLLYYNRRLVDVLVRQLKLYHNFRSQLLLQLGSRSFSQQQQVRRSLPGYYFCTSGVMPFLFRIQGVSTEASAGKNGIALSFKTFATIHISSSL